MFTHAFTRRASLLAFILVALGATRGATADQAAHQNVGGDRVAVQGYDVVSYFFAGQFKGSPNITATYNGATYHFANEFNRKLFNENPAKYAPAYGGWCATAMAEGKKVEIDPGNFRVTNGRLFLFYKGFWGDAQKDWAKNEAALTNQADTAWARLTR